MQRGLYQSKVTFSLAAIQRPGLLAHNCKMAYSYLLEMFKIWEIVIKVTLRMNFYFLWTNSVSLLL